MLPKYDKSAAPGLVDAQISPQEFEFVRTVIEKNAGIVLSSNKMQLVQGRLVRRARELGLNSIAEYCDTIRNGGPEELVGLINAITTNVTSFFRENHHFDALMSVMLPEAMGRNERSRRMRIWSAGCSSGEEPYSIAMASAEVLANTRGWDFKILATDIDSEILHIAETGHYVSDRLTGISEERRRRWFVREESDGDGDGDLQVIPELKNLITFRTLNLMNNWPMRGPFDIIFCRNVMIYFDQPTRDRLLMRYAGLLADGGYLCLGHSESIHSQHSHFKLVGRTIYRKVGG
jgi:chemotaxis protein methyltransferase CheR